MKNRILLSALFTMILVLPLVSQPLPSEKKIDELIGKMTLEEKIDYIGGYQDFHIRAVS
jgi:beta-glucosidase